MSASIRGGPSAVVPSNPNVLIILLGALGDVVRGLAIIDQLKGGYPQSKITWLVEPASEAIVRMHPGIDQVLVFNRSAWRKSVLATSRQLRGGKFDITLDMQRHFKSGLFSWASRAPRRIGFNRKNTKEGNWLFNNEYIPAVTDDEPKLRVYLRFVEQLGISLGRQLSFGLEKGGTDSDVLGALGRKSVGLVLGSSWPSKDWPEEGYRALVQRIVSATNHSIVLIGDRSRSEMGERLASDERVVNLAGKTNVEQLVGTIRNLSVCVGPDSGPGHIAGALGVPHITLFGPTPMTRNEPYGSEGLGLTSAVGCSPCSRKVCPGLGTVCMRLISPEAVFLRIEEVLGER